MGTLGKVAGTVAKGALGLATGGALPAALAVGSELYQGYQNSKKQKQNQQAQQQQFENISGLAQGQIRNAPGAAEGGVGDFLKNMQAPSPYSAQQIDPKQFGSQTVNAQQIDTNSLGIPDIHSERSFNAGQDALMQMVNRDSASQLGAAGTNLTDLANTGGKVDVDNMLSAIGAQQQAALGQQLAQQKASVSGLGQLAGTAAQFAQGRVRNQSMLDNNALNAQVQNQALESAMNRRLSASSSLGQLNLGAFQNQVSAANSLGNFANMAAQSGMQGAGLRLQGQQANQSAALSAGQGNQQAALNAQAQALAAQQANQSAGLAGNAQNNQAAQAGQQTQLSALGLQGQLEQGRVGQNLGAIGMIAGQPVPQQAMGSPFAQSIQTAAILPSVFNRLRKPATGATAALR